MKSEMLTSPTSGLAAELARMNRLMELREREREVEERNIKAMMMTIKDTIQGTVSEIERPPTSQNASNVSFSGPVPSSHSRRRAHDETEESLTFQSPPSTHDYAGEHAVRVGAVSAASHQRDKEWMRGSGARREKDKRRGKQRESGPPRDFDKDLSEMPSMDLSFEVMGETQSGLCVCVCVYVYHTLELTFIYV